MVYEIAEIDWGSTLSMRLSDYAGSCSFQGTGAFFAGLIRENGFEDYEKAFAVISEGKIIGFGAILNECLCLEDDKSTWLDFLFVDEEYRSLGIGSDLIERICDYARVHDFESIYLCTVTHAEYYMRSGFNTLYSTCFFNNTLNDIPIYIMKRELK